MTKPYSAMAEDLEHAAAAHARSAQASVDATAEQMVARVRSLSSPEYGVAVAARTVDITNGKRVDVVVSGTAGPGRVFGGQSAVQAQVVKVIDSTAKEDGLDRRR